MYSLAAVHTLPFKPFLKMEQFKLISVLMFFLIFSACPNHCKGSAFDTNKDVGVSWKINSPWFEYVNFTEYLEEASDKEWYEVDFEAWEELQPVSTGIWALFYQATPPEFGIEPPRIQYDAVAQLTTHSIFITYFLYGNSYLEVSVNGVVVDKVANDCGRNCGFNFTTTRVVLNDIPYAPGKGHFKVELKTPVPGDFILIDMIETDDTTPTTTGTPCDCYPCVETLDTNSTQETFEWGISDSLLYFPDAAKIHDNLAEVLPDLDYARFESAEGIWVLYDPSPVFETGPPSFSFGEEAFQLYSRLSISCYLHKDSFLLVFIGDESEPEVLRHVGEDVEKWEEFTVDLRNTSSFRVQVNLTSNDTVVFLDKFSITRAGCESYSEDEESDELTSTTILPQVCLCATDSPSTTTEAYTKHPTGVTKETLVTESPSSQASESTPASTVDPNSNSRLEGSIPLILLWASLFILQLQG